MNGRGPVWSQSSVLAHSRSSRHILAANSCSTDDLGAVTDSRGRPSAKQKGPANRNEAIDIATPTTRDPPFYTGGLTASLAYYGRSGRGLHSMCYRFRSSAPTDFRWRRAIWFRIGSPWLICETLRIWPGHCLMPAKPPRFNSNGELKADLLVIDEQVGRTEATRRGLPWPAHSSFYRKRSNVDCSRTRQP